MSEFSKGKQRAVTPSQSRNGSSLLASLWTIDSGRVESPTWSFAGELELFSLQPTGLSGDLILLRFLEYPIPVFLVLEFILQHI